MSDEAFARRFYSDRAELIALGVPLHSQRDEFTGEELYTLRSENYFLDELELDDDELAALQTALYMLEGTACDAGPLRLALRTSRSAAPVSTTRRRDRVPRAGARSGLLARDGRSALEARVRDLEAAHDQVQLLVAAARPDRERTLNPYALRRDRGTWYVVGHDLDSGDVRTFRVSRIRSDIRFATRRERDFRLPADFDVDAYRVGEDWQHGPVAGTARIEVNETPPGGCTGRCARRARSSTASSRPSTRRSSRSRAGSLAERPRRAARAGGAASRLRRGAAAGARGARGGAAEARARRPPSCRRTAPSVPPAVAPERFGVLQAPRLPARGLRRSRDAVSTPTSLAARFHIPRGELQDHLSLLNLVNFGGGCYTRLRRARTATSFASTRSCGDVFRLAPRADPLEARAIRLALDIVGPTIAPRCTRRSTVSAEARGDVRPVRGPPDTEPRAELDEEELVATLSRGSRSAGSSRSST